MSSDAGQQAERTQVALDFLQDRLDWQASEIERPPCQDCHGARRDPAGRRWADVHRDLPSR